MKRLQIGTFVRYIFDPKFVHGEYGLVFRVFKSGERRIPGQAVWFGEKTHWKKYCLKFMREPFRKYDISGIQYATKKDDCKLTLKPPKRILKRVEEALLYVVNQESSYGGSGEKLTNLDVIEILAKLKKLL